ncbi:hypothetical protein BDW62DRAFT_200786 [Aspergillus aurantiobrunneus]
MPAKETVCFNPVNLKALPKFLTYRIPFMRRDENWFTQEDLRVGGPKLCEPPCYNIYLPHDHRLREELYTRLNYHHAIDNLARENDITISEIDVVLRKSEYHPEDDPVFTALLYIDHRFSDGWVEFARTVWEYLRGCNLGETSVEMVDYRSLMKPYISPCKPTDAVYPIWEAICGRILRDVDLAGILSVGCHRVGNADEPESSAPHVLVTVTLGYERNWDEVLEEIVGILTESELHMVGVIICKGFAGSCYPSCLCISPHGYTSNHGTLAGFTELRDPSSGKWVEFGLTCFHCVIPGEEDMAAWRPDDVQNWKRNGVRRGDEDAARLLSVGCPSRWDVEEGITDLEGGRSDLKEKIDRAMAKNRSVIGPDEARWRTHINQLRATLDDHKCLMQEYLSNDKHLLGSVFTASGCRQEVAPGVTRSPDSVLTSRDWALVKPRAGRELGRNDRIETSGLVDRLDFLPRGIAIDPEAVLHKIGRISEETKGRYNGLRTARITGAPPEAISLDHTVVWNNGQSEFEVDGDSGAFVYDMFGHVAGMCSRGSGDIGSFSHMHGILDDNGRVMGIQGIRWKQQSARP